MHAGRKVVAGITPTRKSCSCVIGHLCVSEAVAACRNIHFAEIDILAEFNDEMFTRGIFTGGHITYGSRGLR